ncbi:MAG: succinate dehydrogenase assembly factor 2 [Pseudomonadota bacterium]
MAEDIETRRKRLYMRSIRRGIKEMDVILTAFAGARLPTMETAELDAYEAALEEADLDLYMWVSGQSTAPEEHQPIIREIASKFNDMMDQTRQA